MPTSPSSPEQLAPGLTLERLDAGKILVFKIDTMNQITLRAMYDTIGVIQSKMSNYEPYLALYDATANINATVTPVARKLASEVAKKNPQQRGRNALLISPLLTMAISPIKLFIKRDLQRIQRKIEWEIFSEREQALAWLREGLNRESDNAES